MKRIDQLDLPLHCVRVFKRNSASRGSVVRRLPVHAAAPNNCMQSRRMTIIVPQGRRLAMVSPDGPSFYNFNHAQRIWNRGPLALRVDRRAKLRGVTGQNERLSHGVRNVERAESS